MTNGSGFNGVQNLWYVYKDNLTVSSRMTLGVTDTKISGRLSRGVTKVCTVPTTEKLLAMTGSYDGNQNVYQFLFNSTSAGAPEKNPPINSSTGIYTSTGYAGILDKDCFTDRKNNLAVTVFQTGADTNIDYNCYNVSKSAWCSANTALGSWNNPYSTASIYEIRVYSNQWQNDTVMVFTDTNNDLWTVEWTGANFSNTPKNITGSLANSGDNFFSYVFLKRDEIATGGGDVTAPVISGITEGVDLYTANISWTTDEVANSSLKYGITLALGTQITDALYNTTHMIYLPSLTNGTQYLYNVTSCDAAGNCALDSSGDFTTLQTTQWYPTPGPTIFDTRLNLTDVNISRYDTFYIKTNVTHPNETVSSVIVEVIFPDGSRTNYTMVKIE